MGSYGVQTVGILSGFTGIGQFYSAANATVCAGDAGGFSAFAALQNIAPNAGSTFVCGTYDPGSDTGWYMRRNPDTSSTEAEYEVLVSLGSGTINGTFVVSLPAVLGRTLLIGFTVSASTLVIYVNGGAAVEVAGVGTFVPSTELFSLGGLAAGGSNGLLNDRFISFAYDPTVLTPEENAKVWNTFRETGSLQFAGQTVLGGGAGFTNSYEASGISAPPVATQPPTFPNGGALLTGDLAWDGAKEGVVRFSVDSDPDYAAIVSTIVP